jgi:hypothetical protein
MSTSSAFRRRRTSSSRVRSAPSLLAAVLVGVMAVSLAVARPVAAQQTGRRNLTLGFQPGGATQNGYVDAQVRVAYWFEYCQGEVHFVATYDPRPHIVIGPARYWVDGREVQVPPTIRPRSVQRVTLTGTVRGRGMPGPRDIRYVYADPKANCALAGLPVASPSALWKPAATIAERQAAINELGYDDHTRLGPLTDAAVEQHFRTLWAQERKDSLARAAQARSRARQDSLARVAQAQARRDSAERARSAESAPSARSTQSARAGAAQGPSTASAENGAMRRYEAERAREQAAEAERRREAEETQRRIDETHRRNAERQRQSAAAVDAGVSAVQGMIAERARQREAEDERRAAAWRAEEAARRECGAGSAVPVELGARFTGMLTGRECGAGIFNNAGDVYVLRLERPQFVVVAAESDRYWTSLLVHAGDRSEMLPFPVQKHDYDRKRFEGSVVYGEFEAGTYYIAVWGLGDPDTGPYRLIVASDFPADIPALARLRRPRQAALGVATPAPEAPPAARFENVEYISGKTGFETKQKGELLVYADSLTLLKKDGTFVFSIPVATITTVSRERDVRGASAGKKVLFGMFAGSRKQEFVQLTAENATEVEEIVFKVKWGTADDVASKIAAVAREKRGAANVATPAAAGQH